VTLLCLMPCCTKFDFRVRNRIAPFPVPFSFDLLHTDVRPPMREINHLQSATGRTRGHDIFKKVKTGVPMGLTITFDSRPGRLWRVRHWMQGTASPKGFLGITGRECRASGSCMRRALLRRGGLGSSPRAELAARFEAIARVRGLWGTPRTCLRSRRMGSTVAAGRGYKCGWAQAPECAWSSSGVRGRQGRRCTDSYAPAQRGALNQREEEAQSRRYGCNKGAGEGGRGVGDARRAPLAARFAALV
jgi:hypothetical protein